MRACRSRSSAQPCTRLLRRSRGFTLIELLVVLSVIAALLTLVVPRYYQRLDQARETVLRENLRATREVLDRYYGDTGRYPDSLEELVEKRYLRDLPVDPMTESASTWVVIPVPEGYRGQVYDIKSGSAASAGDGTPYAQW